MSAGRPALLALPGLVLFSACSKVPTSRTVEYVEEVRVPPQRGPVRLWLPVPPSDDHQTADILRVEASHPHRLTREPQFGNSILYSETDGRKPFRIRVRYRVTRRLQDGLGSRGEGRLSEEERKLHTSPRGLVVVNERVRKLADQWAGNAQEAAQVARRFYDQILSFMAYDKSSPGWGNGDALRACIVGLGNCTDFHSLFQSVAIAKGIPARFLMGIPLSGESAQSIGRTYHCWAEFHIKGRGWVPVDISEAWKVKAGKKNMQPDWVERYFGTLDQDRILLSNGRELVLEPPQEGPPLNYFAYPYLEIKGRPAGNFEFERSIRDLDARAG